MAGPRSPAFAAGAVSSFKDEEADAEVGRRVAVGSVKWEELAQIGGGFWDGFGFFFVLFCCFEFGSWCLKVFFFFSSQFCLGRFCFVLFTLKVLFLLAVFEACCHFLSVSFPFSLFGVFRARVGVLAFIPYFAAGLV